ncbi:MAG: hypothetical protein ACJAS7_000856, partial [Alpinimonas sp.]
MVRNNLLLGGTWVAPHAGQYEDVHSPFDNRIVGTVAVA